MRYLLLIFLLTGCSANWNNGASMYVGFDWSDIQAPQCYEGPDDQLTSNMGVRYHLYESEGFKANLKYTHHSCLFETDRNLYDAGGIEFEYKLWG